MSFLDNFSSNVKPRIYVSVTPGVGVEMIQLDTENHVVSNYAVRELAYNEASRDIVDYDTFKEAILSMYEELAVNPKCEVVLNMPLVAFGQMQLGLLLPNDAITGAIQSEVEQTYIFRRLDPVISWIDAPSNSSNNTPGKETRTVMYSAIQQNVLDKLVAVFTEIGSVLISVENSLTSTFRALDYMGVTTEQMQPNVTWNLLTVNSTGYTIVSMTGKNVIEYYEEPLPIKSFEGDEIYNAIVQSAQIALTSYPANYLYVISDTDQVSAELLVAKLNVQSNVDYLENNSFKKQDALIPVSLNVLQTYAPKISLQVIGCALSGISDFPLKFSFLGNEDNGEEKTCTIVLGEHEYTLTKKSAMTLVGIAAIVLFVILGSLSYIVLPKIKQAQEKKATEISSKLEQINNEIQSLQGNEEKTSAFDLTREVETGVKANRSKLMNYIAAGDSIPPNVWLTYFMTQGNGLIDIKGSSSDLNSVYVFFKNMRDSLIGTKLKLQKLEMDDKSIDDAVSGIGGNYSFEITNMTDNQLTQFAGAPEAAEGNGSSGANNGNGKENGNNNSPTQKSSGSLLGPEISDDDLR